MSILQKYVLLFDAAVVAFAVFVVRRLIRGFRPLPQHNYRPGDDARSGRRVTLFVRPKDWRQRP